MMKQSYETQQRLLKLAREIVQWVRNLPCMQLPLILSLVPHIVL